jgi:hypothetical protein
MDQKWKLWLLAGLLAALAMVPFVLQRGTINKLRSENAQLQSRVQELGRERQKAGTNALQAAQQQTASPAQEQLLELMRLRAEVTALRKLTNAAAGAPAAMIATNTASAEIAAQTGDAARGAGPTNGPPWNYRGYARPEDTMATMAWAMEQGRLDLLLNSATPEGQAQIQQEYGVAHNPNEKLKAQAGEIVEVRPSTAFPSTENETYLTMVINKPAQQAVAEETMQIGGKTFERGQPYTIGAQVLESVVKLQKVGSEWKFAGKVAK